MNCVGLFCNKHVCARSSAWSAKPFVTLHPRVQPGICLFCNSQVCARSSNWSAKPLKPLVLWCNSQLTYSATHMCMLAAAIGLPLRCNPELIYSATHTWVCSQQQLVCHPAARHMCMLTAAIVTLEPWVQSLIDLIYSVRRMCLHNVCPRSSTPNPCNPWRPLGAILK